MKTTIGPRLALIALFPAALVPIALPALRAAAVSDGARGLAVGTLLGASLLLLTLARRPAS
jgi:hypothetical protein